jgi:hypothetical protein
MNESDFFLQIPSRSQNMNQISHNFYLDDDDDDDDDDDILPNDDLPNMDLRA